MPIVFAEPGLCKYFNQPGINPYTGNELQPALKVFRDCEAEQLAAEDRAASVSAEAERRMAAARKDITALKEKLKKQQDELVSNRAAAEAAAVSLTEAAAQRQSDAAASQKKVQEVLNKLASQRSAAETVVASLTQRLGMLERQNSQGSASAQLRPTGGPQRPPVPTQRLVCGLPLDRFGQPTCRYR